MKELFAYEREMRGRGEGKIMAVETERGYAYGDEAWEWVRKNAGEAVDGRPCRLSDDQTRSLNRMLKENGEGDIHRDILPTGEGKEYPVKILSTKMTDTKCEYSRNERTLHRAERTRLRTEHEKELIYEKEDTREDE